MPPSSESPYGSSGFESSAGAVATQPLEDPLLAGLRRPRRILVAGASGFVGRHLVARLLARGHDVRALARSPRPDLVPGERVEWWAGDVTRPESLRGAAGDREVVFHLVGVARERGEETFRRVHVEGTRNLLAEARRAGARRFILVSVTGARGDGSPFFRSKHQAESEVVASGLPYVIFRPSIIYGPGDQFTSALALLLRRLPVFPVLAVGSLRLQPVAVEDVADALAQAAERSDLEGEVYELAGPERLKFTKIVRTVSRTLDLRRPIVQFPKFLAGPALRLVGWLGLPAPLSPQQLDMFRETSLLTRTDNVLRTVFLVEPLPFRDAVVDYL